MKKGAFLLAILLTLFLFSGNAAALVFDQDYWTPTDLTTGQDGSSFFVLELENAGYDSDFGLYTVDDVNNPTAITNQFEIFSYNQEPTTVQSVYFMFDDVSSTWGISLTSSDNFADYTLFDNEFGFYYGVHTGGLSDATADYFWYTDTQFNQTAGGTLVDNDVEHIGTEWNGTDQVTIFLDDQLGGGDRDFNDMTVIGTDLRPVPEPATLVISSLFLVGAGIYVRRKLHGTV